VRKPSGVAAIAVLVSILSLLTAAEVVWAAPVKPSPGEPARINEVFAKGNALYEQGDYPGAIEQYASLVDAGVIDKDLFYNLANSCYKADDFGRAVLFYERAQRLAPRDRDVRENLALVRSQLRDKQFVREQNRFVRAVAWLHHNLNAKEMTLVGSLCYLSLCLLGIVFVFRDSPRVSAAYRWLSFVSPGRLAGLTKTQDLLLALVVVSLLFLSTGFSAYRKTGQESGRRVAVVVESEAAVFSGPMEETTLQFKIHEGTLVRIREERKAWVRIDLPGGLSGWVSATAVERV
jgi:tetratricopeptide (TPR) repeat protein